MIFKRKKKHQVIFPDVVQSSEYRDILNAIDNGVAMHLSFKEGTPIRVRGSTMNKCDHDFVEISEFGVLTRQWVCGRCGYVANETIVADDHDPTDEELQSAIDSLRVMEKSLESDLTQDV